MVQKIIRFIGLILFLASCTTNHQEQNFILKGNYSHGAGQKLALYELSGHGLRPIDSLQAGSNGSFEFTAKPDEQSFYLLLLKDGKKIPFVAGAGDVLSLSTDTARPVAHYKIAGNSDSKILQHYFNKTADDEAALDSLGEVFIRASHGPDFYTEKIKLDAALDSLINQHRKYLLDLLHSHPYAFADLLLINRQFAGETLIPAAAHQDFLAALDSVLVQKWPGNSHVSLLNERVDRLQQRQHEQQEAEARLSQGKPAPAIALRDADHEKHALADLRGKKVILFFWASWSPESRAAIQQLKALYPALSEKNVGIFAVSLDHNPKIWRAALDIEKMPWINVADDRGMNSPLVRLYNLPQALPYYFLIDGQGKIMMHTSKLKDLEKALEKTGA